LQDEPHNPSSHENPIAKALVGSTKPDEDSSESKGY
jgi:hypothetical protein